MHTRIHHPEGPVPGDELDAYLARGWYRIGQAMVTCRFVWAHDGTLRSAIWTRTRLQGYRFRKSLSRIHRKNSERYAYVEGPLRVDEEHRALYRRYRAHARGSRPPTLEGALHGDAEHDHFDTREIAVRDADGRLVAFSTFDLGRRSLQSLMGVYDPDHAQHSLGFWTLLLEIRHALELGLDFHYAGYVLPGDGSMDYKLRVGAIEYLDPDDNAWRPWAEFDPACLPDVQLGRALHAARLALTRRTVSSRVVDYRYYEAPAWSPALRRGLDQPRVLLVAPHDRAISDLLITWDLDRRTFSVLRCLRAEGVTTADQGDVPRKVALWIVAENLGGSADPDRTAELALAHLGP
jgi:leucyl-tRNA---protein transferase